MVIEIFQLPKIGGVCNIIFGKKNHPQTMPSWATEEF
jgi:hypothetical protein